MKANIIAVTIGLAAFCTSPSLCAIGLSVNGTGTLEDAILIASVGGAPPRSIAVLGDINLSVLNHIYDVPVPAEATVWWLIGHQGSEVVYSSNRDLNHINLYVIEPYDIPGAELAWNIPANLDGYVNGTGYALDWWAQTVSHHSSHVTADGGRATMWFFSDGIFGGEVAVSLHNNIPPPIPEPRFLSGAMLLFGWAGMHWFRRNRLTAPPR